LIGHRFTSLPGEVHEKITTANPEEITGWFDTHLCEADRIRAVRQLNESGIFHSTEPTARLFSDFAALSKTVTRHQYEKHFKLAFTDQDLMSADEFLRESAAIAQAEALVRRYYGDVNMSLHPLLIDRQLPVPAEPAAALAQWRAACKEIEARREEAQKTSAACAELMQRRGDLLTAYHLAAANFQFEAKTFSLPDGAASPGELRTAAEDALPETATAIEEHLVRLEPFFAALRQRIGLALTFHGDNSAASAVAAEESAALVPLLVAVGAEMRGAHDMAAKLGALTALAQNRSNHPDPSRVDSEALKLASDLRAGVIRIKERVGSFTYPFVHPRGHLMIAEYLRAGQLAEHEWQRSYEDGTTHVNRLFTLHYRLIGGVLALADLAEKAMDDHPDRPRESASETSVDGSQAAT
jgi:hypothetical protein